MFSLSYVYVVVPSHVYRSGKLDAAQIHRACVLHGSHPCLNSKMSFPFFLFIFEPPNAVFEFEDVVSLFYFSNFEPPPSS